VTPLATPPAARDGLDGPEDISAYASARFFVERAQAVVDDFVLDDSNASAVARLCRWLDGLPLAIELAAAWVVLMGPEAMLRRMDRRLPLLTDGAFDLPERQQTLRATLAWSHNLLGPAAQMLFRRLAVFAGGWTLEAAEAVCADPQLPARQVLEQLQVLVDSSLVTRLDDGSNESEPRFAMLQTVREFAEERLAEATDAEIVRRVHAAYCLPHVGRALPRGPSLRLISA
jgi:predicted ATPase